MDNLSNTALLPAGLSDLLPPEAGRETAIINAVMHHLDSFGYERVKPPLVEFEESLLNGIGEKCAMSSFRVMDPVSQRMMVMRSDITVQAARIATTRLAQSPRPLRLSYCGEVLRARGEQLRPERQFCQVGVELIGSDSIAADVEVVTLAVSALEDIGIGDLAVDLQMPTLAPALTEEFALDDTVALQLTEALDRKDIAAIPDIGGLRGRFMESLMACVGPVDTVLPRLQALDFPGQAAKEAGRLIEAAAQLRAHLPDLALTIDPVEQRSLDYHTGVTFSVYSRQSRGELGLGGRYIAEAGETCESATGFTLFLDMLLRAAPPGEVIRRVYLPHGTAHTDCMKLRAEGYAVIRQLDDVADIVSEAKRLNCEFLYDGGKIVSIN